MSRWLRNPSSRIRAAGAAMVVAGLLLALVSLRADVLGLSQYPDIFGQRQREGVLVGLALVVSGVAALAASTARFSGQTARWWARAFDRQPSVAPWPGWLISVALLCTILLGAGLRLHGLDVQSLWFDELFTWRQTRVPGLREVVASARDVWPPVFSLIMYQSVRAFGESEFALRFPAALAGVLCIPAIYALGRRLYSSRESLVAAGLMAVLRVAIRYSQEARAYTILIFLAIVTTHLWVGMLRRSGQRLRANREALGYILAALAMAYTLHFGVLFIALQAAAAAWVVWRQRRPWRGIAASYGLILLGYAPWVNQLLGDLSMTSHWIPAPGNAAREVGSFALFLANSSPALLILVAGLSGMGFWALWSNRPVGGGARFESLRSPALGLLLWLLVPFAVTYARSLVATPVLLHRYLLISLPAACLLVARGLVHLPLKPRAARLALAGMLAAFLVELLLVRPFYSTPSKTQCRQAIFAVAQQDARYPDAVIIGQDWHDGEDFEYYFRLAGSQRRPDILQSGAADLPRVAALLSQRQRRYVWFLELHWPADVELVQYLNDRFDLLQHQAYLRADVRLYRNPAVR